jgi:hypothetical protein
VVGAQFVGFNFVSKLSWGRSSSLRRSASKINEEREAYLIGTFPPEEQTFSIALSLYPVANFRTEPATAKASETTITIALPVRGTASHAPRIKCRSIRRQETRKGSNPRQAAPCPVIYIFRRLQGRHLADVGYEKKRIMSSNACGRVNAIPLTSAAARVRRASLQEKVS